MTQDTEPETKKSRKRNPRLWEPFYLYKIVHLSQLILKTYFPQRQFLTPDNIRKLQNTLDGDKYYM